MSGIELSGPVCAFAKKTSKLRYQYTIGSLPKPVFPKTGIKPKHGKDLGTNGLPIFEQKKAEEAAIEQAKQENLFEEPNN